MKQKNNFGKVVGVVAKVPRWFSDQIFGHGHSVAHRCIVGLLIMVIGVSCAKLGNEYHDVLRHIGLDVIGYGLHGVGLSPFLELMMGGIE